MSKRAASSSSPTNRCAARARAHRSARSSPIAEDAKSHSDQASSRESGSSSTTTLAVADELGVSERHLRRVFRDAFGVAPKSFARLARFDRALRAAREDHRAGWASIAASAGYYDQAHLIADFRAIANATPRALLGELRIAASVG